MKTTLSLIVVLSALLAPIQAETADSTQVVSNQTEKVESVSSDSTSAAEFVREDNDQTTITEASALLPTGSALPDTMGLVTRMGLSLFAVIFLIWGAVQILKRFSPGGPGTSQKSNIRVLDRQYIAPKKSIYVVQIGNKALALGVSDQQMSNLTDLDLEETLAQYDTPVSAPVAQRFTDVLKTVNARFTRQTEEPAT